MKILKAVAQYFTWLLAFIAGLVAAFANVMKRLRWVPVAAMLSFLPIVQSADAQDDIGDDEVWLVDGIDGDNMNSGKGSWANARETIQAVLSDVNLAPGDRIWVRATTYRLGSTGSSFELEDGVWLLGGFDTGDDERTDADPYANLTILSGDVDNDDNPSTPSTWDDNAYHVVTANNTIEPLTRLDGFIIEGGNAVGEDELEQFGGGLLFTGDASDNGISLTVTRCRFRDNHALLSGGAAAVWRTGGVSFTVITGHFINCEFTTNGASTGNGDYGGGGVWVYGAHAEITNSLVVDNTAVWGGGLFVEQNCDDDPIPDCEKFGCINFQKTSARVRNCTFAGNEATLGGGAYVERGGLFTDFVGCILWENSDSQSSTIEREQIGQNVYCDETAEVPAVIASFCCIQTDSSLDVYAGNDNFDDDPLFVDDTNGDFRVAGGSPCINSGNFDGFFPDDLLDFDHDTDVGELACDLDSLDRIEKGSIDRGAYEFISCAGDCVTTATYNPPPDGVIEAADLAWLLGDWGTNPGSCADTVTSATFQPPPDGVVNSADLAVLQGNCGARPA